MTPMTEFVYTWPDGREEVRYRRITETNECAGMREQVDAMRLEQGDQCPYSYRDVPHTREFDADEQRWPSGDAVTPESHA